MREQPSRQRDREKHAGHAADERQHEALDQQLPHQAAARRPEREAHGDFLLALKPRAMSRFATFAHAMSSTSPTMHISTISAVEKSLRSDE